MKKFFLLMAASAFKLLVIILFQINCFSIPSPAPKERVTSATSYLHPFYVSVTEFNHNPKDKIIEISCKMFAEDLENTLKSQYRTNIDITHPKDPKILEKYVYEYLQKHLQLKINGKSVTLQFIGYEKEEEAVWGYMQVNNVPVAKKIEVTNNILYELYNTQISIMHASVGGSRKSTRLVYPDTQARFEF